MRRDTGSKKLKYQCGKEGNSVVLEAFILFMNQKPTFIIHNTVNSQLNQLAESWTVSILKYGNFFVKLN